MSLPRAFHNTYEESKAEAEQVVAREIEAGLPITVHRPSMVVGDSISGKVLHFQVFYHLCELLTGRRTLGVYPLLPEARLDVVPSDFVARAIVWSAGRIDAMGKILHLCAGEDGIIGLMDLRRLVRTAYAARGVALPMSVPVPASVFKGAVPLIRLFTSGKTRRALGTLPVFFDYLATRQSFATTQTQRLLAPAGIEAPQVERYLAAVVGYYLDRTYVARR